MLVGTRPQPMVDWTAVLATLPAPRHRRSYFAEKLAGDNMDLSYFTGLLRQLDPARARELREAAPLEHYLAVLRWCFAAFPCNELFVDEAMAEGTICDIVPVDALGFDPYEDDIWQPEIAICLIAYHLPRGQYDNQGSEVFKVSDFSCLSKFAKRIPPALGQKRIERVRVPRGRAWHKPWDGLRDLYQWATAQTGFGMLDASPYELGVNYSYPNWDIDELRSLAQQWRAARPVFERAVALRKYINDSPRKRLPVLANALLGDPATLRQITFKKRSGR